jgi:hypothetical protein
MFPASPPAIIWQQQQPLDKALVTGTPFVCDATGTIRCAVTETVSADASTADMRLIATYISLVSERNRRYYVRWDTKLPSAAYELVRKVRPFPYLPYGDVYAITDMQVILQQSRNRILVRYPKRPNQRKNAELAETDYVTYETPLAAFIKTLEKEIAKLKKSSGPAIF